MTAARPLAAPPDPNAMDHFVYLRVGWDDYEKLLGVREVWLYERGSLSFFRLRGAHGRARYVSIPRSTLLRARLRPAGA